MLQGDLVPKLALLVGHEMQSASWSSAWHWPALLVIFLAVFVVTWHIRDNSMDFRLLRLCPHSFHSHDNWHVHVLVVDEAIWMADVVAVCVVCRWHCSANAIHTKGSW